MRNVQAKFFFISLLIFSINEPDSTFSQGNLVIVGGGLEANNGSVFTQLIDLAGGAGTASFAVIPSAGGAPMQSFVYFRSELISYGVKPENIHLIPVALMDDDSTRDVNESEWKNNGNELRLADLVRKCSAVWFTGGDQQRTMKTLVLPDGSQTPVLTAVWDVYRTGGVIGGTSAGAAIMSEAMICGGNSLGALIHGVISDYQGDDFPDSNGVLMSRGLGFFPGGIVDQHFQVRSRIGRLAVALMKGKPRFNLGFGIDENTALIYFGKKHLVMVAGASGVTILNSKDARISYVQDLPRIENITVNYLEQGDSFNIINGKITAAVDKKPTRGIERFRIENSSQTGILSSHSVDFYDLITTYLMDQKEADKVENISFYSQNSGFMVTFSKTPSSEVFYLDLPDCKDQYSVTNIRMDIIPVEVSIKPIK